MITCYLRQPHYQNSKYITNDTRMTLPLLSDSIGSFLRSFSVHSPFYLRSETEK